MSIYKIIPELSPRPIALFSALTQGCQAGMSVAGVLDHELWPEAVPGLLRRLEGGASLAEAMSHDREAFPPWQVAMVEMGEATGRLGMACELIAGILEVRRAHLLKLASGLAAPFFMMLLAPMLMGVSIWASRGFAAYFVSLVKALAPLCVTAAVLALAWPRLRARQRASPQRR